MQSPEPVVCFHKPRGQRDDDDGLIVRTTHSVNFLTKAFEDTDKGVWGLWYVATVDLLDKGGFKSD